MDAKGNVFPRKPKFPTRNSNVSLLLLFPVIYQWIAHYVNHYLSNHSHSKEQVIINDYSKKRGKGLTSIYE